MRTPVGSSKIVARSRLHNSPACEPSGVIFTFCAQTVEQPAASASTPMTHTILDAMTPPSNGRELAAPDQLSCQKTRADAARFPHRTSWCIVESSTALPNARCPGGKREEVIAHCRACLTGCLFSTRRATKHDARADQAHDSAESRCTGFAQL